MRRRAIIRGVPLLALAASISAGCMHNPTQPAEVSSRGTFASGSCAAASRVGVPDDAVAAVYVDEDGKEVGQIESLRGTDGKQMCATPPVQPPVGNNPGPGTCAPGFCLKTVLGTTRKACLPC